MTDDDRGWRDEPGHVVTGSRAELIERLAGIAAGCLGSEIFRAEASEAARQITEGSSRARAGHAWYYVEGDG